MRNLILAALLALSSSVYAQRPHNPYNNMNLTDLANHICEQCDMNDTDDVSAAEMFLQRRLEMIWNTQLWRSSLIEVTLTLNPDGTTTLADTVWIPARATLLLPTEFDSVLSVRADNHAMNVASLESYYRTDTDWLDMQGDPTEFQILRPAAWEFPTPTTVRVDAASTVVYSPDGVTKQFQTIAGQTQIPNVLLLMNVSGQAAVPIDSVFTQNNVLVLSGFPQSLVINPNNNNGTGDLLNGQWNYAADITGNGNPGFINGNGGFQFYMLPNTGNDPTVPGVQLNITEFGVSGGLGLQDAVGSIDVWGVAGGPWYAVNNGNNVLPGASAAFEVVAEPIPGVSYPTPIITNLSQDARWKHQRIRLTTTPQVSVNLRVLGKGRCPILGQYDRMPINNVEPAVMAFARGDMLLRARQNGKAQLASQEGATLLAQLARSEAFQSAGRFQIMPDNGFGGDNIICQPNSLHPL